MRNQACADHINDTDVTYCMNTSGQNTSRQNRIDTKCTQPARAAYPENLLYWVHALAEHVHAQLLKPRPGDAGVEVNALKQTVNLDGCLC